MPPYGPGSCPRSHRPLFRRSLPPSPPHTQIGDFGSARSAKPQGYQWAEQGPPGAAHAGPELGGGPRSPPLHPADSYQAMNDAMQVGGERVTKRTREGSRA